MKQSSTFLKQNNSYFREAIAKHLNICGMDFSIFRFVVISRIFLSIFFIVGLFTLLWYMVDNPFGNENWRYEFIGGLSTSLLFFILIYLMRPHLKISPQIAYKEGKYFVKIVNASLASVVDVKVEVKVHKSRETKRGSHVDSGLAKINQSTFNILPGQLTKSGWKYKEYAQWIEIQHDLDQKWDGILFNFMSVNVVAKHGISGMVGSSKKLYYSKKESIKKGEFLAGNRLEIRDI